MKKLALTIAIVLGMCFTSFAQSQRGGGLFQYGWVSDEEYYGATYNPYTGTIDLRDPLFPRLPIHDDNQNQNAPLGSGALLLIGFGAAYALKKKSSKR